MSKGAIPEEANHPFILSKDQHISGLILKHMCTRIWAIVDMVIHCLLLEEGSGSQMLAQLCGRLECSFCRRYNGRAIEQKMADLPGERILPDLPPFTNSGADYFSLTHLTSDNGTKFTEAERELREAVAGLNYNQIQRNLSQVGIHWSFNPPAGSYHGGV